MPETRWRTAATSALIIGVVGLQLQAFVPVRFGIALGTWAWPIIDYPMYGGAVEPGPVEAARQTIRVRTASGETHTLTKRHRRLVGAAGGGMFGERFSVPMLRGEEPAARELIRRLNRHRDNDPYVSASTVFERYVFDSKGLRKTETEEHRFELEARGP